MLVLILSIKRLDLLSLPNVLKDMLNGLNNTYITFYLLRECSMFLYALTHHHAMKRSNDLSVSYRDI